MLQLWRPPAGIGGAPKRPGSRTVECRDQDFPVGAGADQIVGAVEGAVDAAVAAILLPSQRSERAGCANRLDLEIAESSAAVTARGILAGKFAKKSADGVAIRQQLD